MVQLKFFYNSLTTGVLYYVRVVQQIIGLGSEWLL